VDAPPRRALDRLLDRLAMGVEGWRPRPAVGFRPLPGPLDLTGPEVLVPEPPAAPATWRFPAPAWGGPPGDAVEVRLFPAAGPRRGTALVLPPWKNAAPGLYKPFTSLLAGLGLEVWHLVPPLHLGRTPPGARSGEAYLTPDLPRLAAALCETVREARALAAAAARRGPVGLLGLSLGGLAAAHALPGSRLACAALLAPPVDLAALFGQTPVGARYRRLAERAGAPFPAGEALLAALAPFAPAGRPDAATRLLVAAGTHDLVVPAEGPARLARRWGVEPRLFPRGHLTLLLACPALRAEVGALFGAALR